MAVTCENRQEQVNQYVSKKVHQSNKCSAGNKNIAEIFWSYLV